MAETEKKISELNTASQINDTDLTILSQGSSGSGFASVKATILAIANKIVSGINFTSALQTTDKTITGAINEVAQGGGGGSSTLAGLSDVDIDSQTLADGQILTYDDTENKWVNTTGGSGTGGHTIIDDSGSSMTARTGLQFENAYVQDDSTNNKTIVPIYQEVTEAEYSQMSADEKTGLVIISDKQTGLPSMASAIAPEATSPTTSAISSGSHFMYNGVRMVATSAIASGATLVVYPTVGYNCKAESVEDSLFNIELLADCTNVNTEYNLSKDLSNFKCIVATAYLSVPSNEYQLTTTMIPTSTITYGESNFICCYNDGTIRKGQILLSSSSKVKTSPSSSNWQNITGVRIYGIK